MTSGRCIAAALLVPFALCSCAGNSQPEGSQAVAAQSSAGSSSANPSDTASATTSANANPEPTPSTADAGMTITATTDAGTASPAVAEAPMPPMPSGLHGPATPWNRMSGQARARYMQASVLPAMTALFQAYDASRFSTVDCATCHGPNARATHFHMPSPSLPALPAFGSEASNTQISRHSRMFQFMGQRVVPVMATLIGEAPYDPQTHQGFGCFECHTHATN